MKRRRFFRSIVASSLGLLGLGKSKVDQGICVDEVIKMREATKKYCGPYTINTSSLYQESLYDDE